MEKRNDVLKSDKTVIDKRGMILNLHMSIVYLVKFDNNPRNITTS